MINKIINDINNRDNKGDFTSLVLLTHKSVDYDAVASTLTLANYLRKELDSKVIIIPILEENDFKLISEVPYLTDAHLSDKIEIDYAIVLDTNEPDRINGLDTFYAAPLKNRYLYNHHQSGQFDLEVISENKVINEQASSTCEILGRELHLYGNLTPENSFNIYHGIVADTLGLTRNVTISTQYVIDALALTPALKHQIYENITTMSPEQKIIYDNIKCIHEESNLKMYYLKKDASFLPNMRLLKHETIEKKIAPSNGLSIFIIDCGSDIYVKMRKSEDCEIDLLKIAKSCHGAGNELRATGHFSNTNLNDVYTYLENLIATCLNKSTKEYLLLKSE